MDNISDILDYEEQVGCFIKIVIQLQKRLCNPRTRENPVLEEFLHFDLNGECSHCGEIRDAIDEFKVVSKYGKWDYIDEIIGFVYANVIELEDLICSATFVDNVKGLMYCKTNMHHSHITGDIIGYSHSYCNLKVKGYRDKISVIPHNLFRFDFFLFPKRGEGWLLENYRHFYRR